MTSGGNLIRRPSSLNGPSPGINCHPPQSSASTYLLKQPQRRPECLLAVLKRTLARFEIGPHASNLFGLRSDKAHLIIRHLTYQHGRERVVGEIAQQVTLDHLLGDGADEVLDFLLYEKKLAVSIER